MSSVPARASILSRRARHAKTVRRVMIVAAACAAFGLVALVGLAPPPQTPAYAYVQASVNGSLQIERVPGDAAGLTVTRDDYGTTSAATRLAAGSTNRDWASLVLALAGFPLSEGNITVMLRWMRQENGTDDWWNRNNPLNNGWGSGGGSGFGSYDTLVTAAANCAEALHSVGGYSAIVAGFAASAPTSQIEQAIWASPWASSHYANGSHWSYTDVPIVASPAGTW